MIFIGDAVIDGVRRYVVCAKCDRSEGAEEGAAEVPPVIEMINNVTSAEEE